MTFGGVKEIGGFQNSKIRFKKIEKASYRTVVPNRTENFNTLAQLESEKEGELKCGEKERKKRGILDPFLVIIKVPQKKLNIGYFYTRIFAIRSCVPTE